MINKEKILVLASNNKGKLTEFERLLKPLNIKVLPLSHFKEIGEIEETGKTFNENSLLKARTVAMKTGYISLADDSGLEVDYLDGRPGIYSARFAGEPKDDKKNNEKLLELLKGVPEAKRGANFKCVISIVIPKGEEYVVEGTVDGIILEELKGEGGFGYDPLFYIKELDKSFAELDMDAKNKISHRGKAVVKAIKCLENIFS